MRLAWRAYTRGVALANALSAPKGRCGVQRAANSVCFGKGFEEIIELVQRFDVVRSKALPEDESLNLITHYLGGYDHDHRYH